MPYYMYVAVNEDNKISVFTVDPESGSLTHQHDVAVVRRSVCPGDQSLTAITCIAGVPGSPLS